MQPLRYSTVWEDADVLCAALSPIATQRRILSIASAGDNVLALLTLDPAEVVVIDNNAAQLYLLELKCAFFAFLQHNELLQVLGVIPSNSRILLYKAARPRLSTHARAYWDERPEAISAGVINIGRFERYLSLFRRLVLPVIHSKGTSKSLIACTSPDAALHLYDHTWNTKAWRALFYLFFNRLSLSAFGRSPAAFAEVDQPIAATLLNRIRETLSRKRPSDNPYLSFLLTGTYRDGCYPVYLRSEFFDLIRGRLNRLTLRHTDARSTSHLAKGGYHGFNLSNIFEYMTDADFNACYRVLLSQGAHHARLVYWNLFLQRHPSPYGATTARRLAYLARDLQRQDCIATYSSLCIDEVL